MSTKKSLSRRDFFSHMADGVHGAALAALLGDKLMAAPGKAKAKSIIHLFMTGGPSQVDLFDPKPTLKRLAGSAAPRDVANEIEFTNEVGGMLPSPFDFKRYGKSGIEMSELLPNLGSVIDDVCLISSTYG